jgi:protein-S-isoprenylcysteine O-methyltransferase Ste14
MSAMSKLIISTLKNFVLGAAVLGALLFIPAWTLNYWQAWVFIVVFMLSVSVVGLYLALKDPALLERRQNFGPAAEQNAAQKIIISIAIIADLALLVFAALDHRFGWSPVPAFISLLGDLLVALGLLIDLIVFKENSYGASTVQAMQGQTVVSTGPYALVRHPMYTGVLIMIAGVPIALGSWWGLAILVLTAPILAWRILDEEKLLSSELPGYRDYTQRVRYRLVPYLW